LSRTALTRGLLALAVVTPGLALGAVHPLVLAAYVGLAAILLVLLALGGRRSPGPRLDLASILLLGMAVYTGLQLVPLPSGLVELISPTAHAVRSRALAPLGIETAAWMPLTLDRTLTVLELGKLLFYLAVYWTCYSVARRSGSKFTLRLIVAAAAAAAAVLLAHKILMLDQIYGFYEPVHLGPRGERVSAPLINENHMAALLGFGAAIAIGQALEVEERSSRIMLALLAALIGGSLLLTLSRGGIAAFVAGQLVFIALRVLTRITRRSEPGRARQLAWVPLGLTLSLALGLFAAQDAIIGEFAANNNQKIEMLGQGLPLIGKFAGTGVGRGAFWVGFPLVSDWAAGTTYTHAENVLVQLLVDYGVIVGGLALLGFAVIMGRQLLRPPRRAWQAAALAALAAFGVHNLVDFNLEIPAVAVLAVALLATLNEARGADSTTSDRRRRHAPKLLVLATAAGALSVGALIFLSSGLDIDREGRGLRAALSQNDPAPFSDAQIRPLLERHPADWYIPFLVGVERYRAGDQNPLPWFARALELNPSAASAHLWVGRTMLRSGRLDQGMLEIRLAARLRPGLAREGARFLVSVAPRFADLKKVAVDRDDKLLLWGALASELASRNLEREAEAADLAVLKVEPREPRSLARQARRLKARGEIAAARELVERLRALPDYRPSAALIESEIHRSQGEPERAVAALERAIEADPTHQGLLRALAWAAQRAGRHDRAIEAAELLGARATGTKARAAAAVLEGDLERAEGRVQAALACYRQAHALIPSDLALLERIVDLAEQHGDLVRAIESLRKMVNLQPANADWKARLERLEDQTRARRRAPSVNDDAPGND